MSKALLTITEVGMLLCWASALLLIMGVIYIPPEYMYSDYTNPLVVSWNWSFFPSDVIFAAVGLYARFAKLSDAKANLLSIFSLSLMFCAGLMAIAYWAIQLSFDPFWWGMNLWLMALPAFLLKQKYSTLIWHYKIDKWHFTRLNKPQ